MQNYPVGSKLFACCEIFHYIVLSSADFFFKSTFFSTNNLRNSIRVSNSLHPARPCRCFVGPDLCPNSFADGKICQWQNMSLTGKESLGGNHCPTKLVGPDKQTFE